jgi:PTS system ascorbate-specific IIA component
MTVTEYLSKKTIACNVRCDDWQSAIAAAGRILFDNGIVEGRFVEKMIGYVEQFGPYIVLLPGFALAHARPEDGAVKTGLSLITLKHPVPFGHQDHDPVRIVVALASHEKGIHLECLGDIVQVVNDGACRERILAATEPEGIVAVFSDFELGV